MKRLIFCFLALVAYSEESSCDTTCAEGHKLVSFADGNTPRCVCVAETENLAEPPSGCVGECEEDNTVPSS
ncbi:MAG: hypothetical protein NZO16_07510 [Deltaproteobacteria bacterium]|nr:hypothetical protein [Deltaproteobacteria bacterium]